MGYKGWPAKEGRMKWLIWSFNHMSWWAPNSLGYVHTVAEAGRYTDLEAVEIMAGDMMRQCAPVNEKFARDDWWPATANTNRTQTF